MAPLLWPSADWMWLCWSVPSNVPPAYAASGGALISATVLGIPEVTDAELERLVRGQLGNRFGSAVSRWEHLRTYRIQQALPASEPRWAPVADCPTGVRPARFVWGDHRENPSIQGAVALGRRAAASVLAAME